MCLVHTHLRFITSCCMVMHITALGSPGSPTRGGCLRRTPSLRLPSQSNSGGRSGGRSWRLDVASALVP